MNKKYLLALAACTLMFAACGDDVTEVTNIQQSGLAVLEKGEKLSKQACDTTNVGEMLFVMDSSEAFICDGESWQTLKGEKGEKGDKGSKGDSGKNGEDGNDGNDGTSCTTKSVENDVASRGFEVTCGKTVIDTIWNGEKGADGKGCSLEDDGEGTVSVTCGEGEGATTTTIFKAVCGAKPYDPAKLFCSDGELYSCNDKPYDPAKSFCLEGELYDLCDGKTYDPAKSFCSEGELYSCNDKPYDPKKQYCLKVTRNETDIYSVEDLLTDSRDKHVYKTVEICNTDKSVCQTWMAENLNYDPGDVSAMGEYAWSGCDGEGTLTNEKVAANCAKYGRLYTWEVTVDNADCAYGKTCTLPTVVQGVCPSGWHLPTDAEWETLFTAVGGASTAGKMLKSQTGWYNNGNGEDAYGFSALPAGDRIHNGSFLDAGSEAYFWSASEIASSYAYVLYLYATEYANLVGSNKDDAFSVRCLRDSN